MIELFFFQDTCMCSNKTDGSKFVIDMMSDGCDETWSKGLPGPSGQRRTLEEREGWALFCTTDICADIASGDNFYEDSPGNKDNAVYISTTTTTTSAFSTYLTTPLTSTTNLFTTTSTTTTRTPSCCKETQDDRNMTWAAMCPNQNGELVQNRTDGCPLGTTGFAYWTCNPFTGNFSPPQPDRTHCYADWVSHVVEMVLFVVYVSCFQSIVKLKFKVNLKSKKTLDDPGNISDYHS